MIYFSVIHISLFISYSYKFDLTDIVQHVRAGLDPPFRPLLPEVSDPKERETVKLMVECWSENPSDRPDLVKILSKLRTINGGKLVPQ